MNNSDLSDSWDEPLYYDNNYEISPTYHTPRYEYFNEIRLSIFSISAVCVGLPCLIWAFYSVHRLRKAKGRISVFMILLLLSDLLQLLLYPYIVTKVLTRSSPPEIYFIIFVAGCLKICSLHLQQLVALEWILTLKYPTISAHVFSYPCYIMISIIILLIPVISVMLFAFFGVHGKVHGIFLAFGSIFGPVCLLVVTGIIIYKVPPTAVSTPVTHRPGVKVFTVSLVTLLVLYLPCVSLCSIYIIQSIYNHIPWIVMTLCLISLTVISEPLLCVLVCRENLSTKTQHTQIELNAEETPV